MNALDLFVLSIVQGVGEFLPISSSAHLNWTYQFLHDASLPFSLGVVLQLASIFGVLLYLREELTSLFLLLRQQCPQMELKALFSDPDFHSWFCAGVANIPVVIVGLSAKDRIEQFFADSRWTFLFLGITGLSVLLADHVWRSRRIKGSENNSSGPTYLVAIIVGLIQVFALLPGISRFGSTVMCLLFMGFAMKEAIRFSFQIGAIVLLAAGLKESISLIYTPVNVPMTELGILAAITAAVAMFCGPRILRFFERYGLRLPAIYCCCISIIGFIMSRI